MHFGKSLLRRVPEAAPPDFVGVGVQRAGTTWWFRLLLQHPGVWHSTAGDRQLSAIQTFKELHFFDRFCAEPMNAVDVARYHALFPRIRGVVRGEWTPRYMYDPWTPPLLARAAPDAKLLVLLRDPVERYRSGLSHQSGSTPQRLLEAMAVDAVNRSRYAVQIAWLREHFPAEQILVLQYERCREDTAGQFARTLRFLGVRDDVEPAEVSDLPRVTAVRRAPVWPELEALLRAALEPDVRTLLALVPDLDLGLWPNFAHLAGRSAVG